MTRRSFDALVDEAAGAPVDGWDFSWLEGRATEERPSWGYQRLEDLHRRIEREGVFCSTLARTLVEARRP